MYFFACCCIDYYPCYFGSGKIVHVGFALDIVLNISSWVAGPSHGPVVALIIRLLVADSFSCSGIAFYYLTAGFVTAAVSAPPTNAIHTSLCALPPRYPQLVLYGAWAVLSLLALYLPPALRKCGYCKTSRWRSFNRQYSVQQ